MDYYKKSLELHRLHHGKLSVVSTVPLTTREDLSTAYTPGVAQPCREIAADPDAAYLYTTKGNMVAVVTDGSAVLGLGNIGPLAALPVMEGKAVLFKAFAGVDAVPVCLDTQDTDALVAIITALAPTYGGINLEDIAAPRCFEIERRVQAAVNIPVFHDDQHGTAIVVSAAALNAAALVGKKLAAMRIVINGAGSAGTAIARMLLTLGADNILVCDQAGILCRTDTAKLNSAMAQLAADTNSGCEAGTLADAMRCADLFIGVSAPGVVTSEMVASMNSDAIVFPMANPEPEITPEQAFAGGARIVGTGRSDYPNQINNVLAFPGIFKGALAARAQRITEEMKAAAAYAIAACVPKSRLADDCIIPSAFEPGVAEAVAEAVAKAWESR
ncbi:MAG: NADP-dependent malic enzyme [Ruthenibacterium sp.]